jgi:ribosome-binding protein aMBF1 (putative translation factor)
VARSENLSDSEPTSGRPIRAIPHRPVRATPDRPARATPHDDDGRLAQESEFLSQLGGRVREMRALHGLSRRELARRSHLSERYVAQIEAGKGNVSIVRLLRIALVFRCDGTAA